MVIAFVKCDKNIKYTFIYPFIAINSSNLT